MPDIIVVEDNREIGTLLCDFLRKENYTVSLADTGEKALQIFEQYGANLVVIDIGLPGVGRLFRLFQNKGDFKRTYYDRDCKRRQGKHIKRLADRRG